MRKKGKAKEKSDIEYEKLSMKILDLKDNIMEEFDMIELIEDSIKEVFDCNLNCATCSHIEQGKCMQNFKKANLYWLRKIAQDEQMLTGVVEKIEEMRETLTQQMKETTKYIDDHYDKTNKFEQHKEQVKRKVDSKQGYNYHT